MYRTGRVNNKDNITLVSLLFTSVSTVDFGQCLGGAAQWIEAYR